MSLVVGVLADRVKVWKLMLFWVLVIISSVVILISSVPSEDHIYSKSSPAPFTMALGFILCGTAAPTTISINMTMLGKAVADCSKSKAMFFSAGAFINGICILVINGLGGALY